MSAKKARLHQKVQKPKARRKPPTPDVWAEERKALADGKVAGPRGRPRRAPSSAVAPPPGLALAVQRAEGADGLIRALKGIATAALKRRGEEGYLEPKVANVLLNIAKETRQVQMRLKAKEGIGAQLAGAFEVLTEQEREVLEAYREGHRVAPLKPGETPPPPPMDEEPEQPASERAGPG
jgi:hypothetical protein